MTITYQYRHLGKPNPVHRTTEPATAPIGQEAPEIAAATHHCVDGDCIYFGQPTSGISCGCHKTREQMLWARIRKVEFDNEAAAARIRRLEADLLECREYLETEMDVVDGDYGQEEPNKAMRLVTMIDQSIGEGR